MPLNETQKMTNKSACHDTIAAIIGGLSGHGLVRCYHKVVGVLPHHE